jgi:alkylmercury lyase
MQHPSLDTLVTRLLEPLRREQELLSRMISDLVARGVPVEKAALAAALHVSSEELEQHLVRLPDLEYDQHGHIVGWGVTLVPTRHRFRIHGRDLFTWCAFDTLLYPPQLRTEAHVQSVCPMTGRAITFVATPDGGVRNLVSDSCVLSVIIPTEQQNCGRAGFCERSLFFWNEQAASSFLIVHPEAILLSITEAAFVGKQVAKKRAMNAVSDNEGRKGNP